MRRPPGATVGIVVGAAGVAGAALVAVGLAGGSPGGTTVAVRSPLAGTSDAVTTGAPHDAVAADDPIDRALARAARTGGRPYVGEMTVVTFSGRGARVAEIDLTRGEGSVRMARDGGWELERAGGEAFLRSPGGSLRIGGVERLPDQLDRLRTKYAVEPGAPVELDTGPAVPLALVERATAVRREVLYLDEETGLCVRRETFSTSGEPVRVVAYTALEVGGAETRARSELDGDPAAPGPQRAASVDPADIDRLRAAGFEVPGALPRRYELLAVREVADAAVPTVHLMYGDGLYTLSVFQQRGRLSRTAVAGALELRTSHGGAVWRWPGSEPRRIVWSGGGSTFTALTDAPTDELLELVDGLPIDPAPSTLDRLRRGMTRVGRWFWPTDRSET